MYSGSTDIFFTKTEHLRFEDLFNLSEIQQLQDLFSDTNGVASLITTPEGTPITQSSNFCRLCENVIRRTEKGRNNCYHSDQIIGRQNTTGPTILPCLSAGIIDAGASISINGKHIANWLIGQVRTENLDEDQILRYADEIGVDIDEFREALQEVPTMSIERFTKISNLLFEFAKELSEKAYFNWQLKQQLAELKRKTELLQDSEYFFKAAQKAALVGSFKIDYLKRKWIASSVLMQVLGVDKNFSREVESLSLFIHPDDRLMLIKHITEKVLRKKQPLNKEFRIVRISDSEVRWVLALGNATFNHDGSVNAFTGIIRDITKQKSTDFLLKEERKKIEEQNEKYRKLNEELTATNAHLERSEETYRMLFESINDAVFIIEVPAQLKKLKFVKVNQIACQRLGYTMEELIRISPFEISFENSRSSMITTFNEILENSRLIKDVEYRTKSGKIVPSEISAKVFHHNNKTYIHIIARDITKRILAEAQNKMLRHSLDVYTDGIYWINSANLIVYVNDAGARLFGNKPEELLGKSIFDIHPRSTPEMTDNLWHQLRTKGTYTSEVIYKRRDGKEVYLEIRSVYFVYNGIEYNNGYVRDITERKLIEKELIIAKERAEESDRLKSAFLHNMSHEIRTPMNAIMGFSDLLLEHMNDKPKLESFINIINRRSNDLLVILDDILNIAKIESGDYPVNVEKCNIVSLFEELNQLFTSHQVRFGKLHINLRFGTVEQNGRHNILIDKEKLSQIFINLIGNAFKYTEQGYIEVGLKFDSENRIIFFVTDTGIGIPKEKQELIFERFHRIEPFRNHIFGGNGLGLTIAKGFVEVLGGRIWVDSEPGKGSTFYFTVSYQPDTVEMPEPEAAFIQPPQIDFYNQTILVVEEDNYNSEYIREVLSERKVQTIFTRFGYEAVHIVEHQSIDLVLMDIGLPDISGYEATRMIKQLRNNLPVIAQTANTALGEKKKALKIGCSDYISKPLKKESLLRLIDKYLIV